MSKKGIIYKITNPNSKIYIGQTTKLLKRKGAYNASQERMYSEGDILDAWELGAREGLPLTREKKEKLFNQFKKK